MSAMDITIHSSFLPHDDPDASLAFYRDTLGFEVRLDVQRLRVLPVHPVADTAQQREVAQVLDVVGSAGHMQDRTSHGSRHRCRWPNNGHPSDSSLWLIVSELLSGGEPLRLRLRPCSAATIRHTVSVNPCGEPRRQRRTATRNH